VHWWGVTYLASEAKAHLSDLHLWLLEASWSHRSFEVIRFDQLSSGSAVSSHVDVIQDSYPEVLKHSVLTLKGYVLRAGATPSPDLKFVDIPGAANYHVSSVKKKTSPQTAARLPRRPRRDRTISTPFHTNHAASGTTGFDAFLSLLEADIPTRAHHRVRLRNTIPAD